MPKNYVRPQPFSEQSILDALDAIVADLDALRAEVKALTPKPAASTKPAAK